MSAEDYITVFDITKAGFKSWYFSAFGLIFIVIGFALPTLIRRGLFRQPPPWMEKWFPRFFLGFAILWTSTTFIGTFADYWKGVHAMHDNRAEVVEGLVTQFKPMPYGGHANESFVVQGVRFEYSDYGVTAGFNNTASHGGPIRERFAHQNMGISTVRFCVWILRKTRTRRLQPTHRQKQRWAATRESARA